jgi:dienelactone hydrolase
VTLPSRRRFARDTTAALLASWAAGSLSGQERGTIVPLRERIAQDVAAAPLALRFTGSTGSECRRWQAAFRKQLVDLLGPYAPPTKWETVVKGVVYRKDHSREELILQARGLPPLPIYLLLPRPKSGKRGPGVLALHGHGPYGHHAVAGRDDLPGVGRAIKESNYDYGRQLVRRGYAVVVPCLTPFGDRLGKREAFGKQDPCTDTFIRLQLLGRLLIAENLRDALWALELLARHDEVDAARLGCVGLSYGGRMTMLTAALEPRIRVAVVSGALNLMQERIGRPYGCGAQIIPGMLKYGDTPEIGSLIAPRPCLWEAGLRDGLIPAKEADEMVRRMRKAYRALDAEANLQIDRFEGGHVYNGKAASVLLDRVLKK